MQLDSLISYLVVGLIVSMDVMALTLAKRSTFTDPWKPLLKWAALNALWHSGLLIVYLFLFQLIVEGARWVLGKIDLSWIEFNIPWYLLPHLLIWVICKLRLHVFSIFGGVAVLLVWMTYSSKIVNQPIIPEISSLPWWMRPLFRGLSRALSNKILIMNLQAALVAVDMLALAALMKASEETSDVAEKIVMIAVIGIAVLFFTLCSIAFAKWRLSEDQTYMDGSGDQGSVEGRKEARMWILITLRLVEPLLIFYFLVQLLATMATGIKIDSPALLFAAVIMVVAIVQMHGLARICDAARAPQ